MGAGVAAVAREVAAHAFGPHSAVPCLTLPRHPGGRTVHVTLVAPVRDAFPPQALREAVTAEVADAEVLVRFPGEAAPQRVVLLS